MAALCIAGEAECLMGQPYTAHNRVAALIGSVNCSDTTREGKNCPAKKQKENRSTNTLKDAQFQRVKISVVVPAFNEEKLIGATLRSIKEAGMAFQEAGWETELVVCNNNSSDATADVAQREGARVVFEGVNQIGRARHAGACAATGDWLVFVDAD